MRWADATHTGHKRDHNEDVCLSAPEINLWLVADGMGGHEHGEVASALARDTVREAISSGRPLEDAIREAAQAVSSRTRTGLSSSMGTTIVAARVDGNGYEIGWVGDSRAYLQPRDGKLHQLTHDHSYVQELMDGGAISEKEAEGHPQRHVITQALGVTTPDSLRVDHVTGSLEPGDQLLLCSDGLNTEVGDHEISEILTSEEDVDDKVNTLIETALEHGGSDNVTVVLLQMSPDSRPTPFWRRLFGK